MADLLTSIRAEIEARLRELKPALTEFEQLSTAAEALAEEGGDTAKPARPARPAKPARPTKRAASRRRSARASAPAGQSVRAKTEPVKSARRARKREQPALTPTGQAILAALEHGSHTLAELVVVTALGASDIREALRQLRKRKAIVKTDREGKAAYALPSNGAE
jgi:hypothetical protein